MENKQESFEKVPRDYQRTYARTLVTKQTRNHARKVARTQRRSMQKTLPGTSEEVCKNGSKNISLKLRNKSIGVLIKKLRRKSRKNFGRTVCWKTKRNSSRKYARKLVTLYAEKDVKCSNELSMKHAKSSQEPVKEVWKKVERNQAKCM